jgi:hypothetical protein
MWSNTISLKKTDLRDFEQHFHCKINPAIRLFLADHNAGYPVNAHFPTEAAERRMERLLNFSDRDKSYGAWRINERLRPQIGTHRIVIGVDCDENYVILERDGKQDYIVVWSHITGEFERCLLDIPAFLRAIS